MSRILSSRPLAAGVLGALAFILIGWCGLLIPSLIRSVKVAFGETDAGIGVFYLLFGSAYACGSLAGGLATERLGRRTVLAAGAAILAGGLVTLATAPSWPLFLAGALPMGLGIGVVDGGVNGLFLDLFRSGRGRALNLLHVFFSLGAFGAPLVIGRLVDGGTPWQSILMGTALVAVPIALLFAIVAMPGGRRPGLPRPAADASVRVGRLAAPLALLAAAIGLYVASSGGVSNWMVRFLEPAPLEVATTTLALYWAGLTLGRLVGARIADRFEHVRFTTLALAGMTAALLAAILAPSLPLSMGLFALAGFASGPIYPMIIAIGGERYPDRSAAVGGLLSGAAVAGTIIYPPLMGLMSVTVGLTVAMLGTVLLLVAAAGALALVGRGPRPGTQVAAVPG